MGCHFSSRGLNDMEQDLYYLLRLAILLIYRRSFSIVSR